MPISPILKISYSNMNLNYPFDVAFDSLRDKRIMLTEHLNENRYSVGPMNKPAVLYESNENDVIYLPQPTGKTTYLLAQNSYNNTYSVAGDWYYAHNSEVSQDDYILNQDGSFETFDMSGHTFQRATILLNNENNILIIPLSGSSDVAYTFRLLGANSFEESPIEMAIEESDVFDYVHIYVSNDYKGKFKHLKFNLGTDFTNFPKYLLLVRVQGLTN